MSFHYVLGVETVDDLLERIDEAVERAKIIVNDGKDRPAINKAGGQNAAAPGAAPGADNAEKKPEGDEPIRIVHGDIHKIEDLLAAVNDQPGDRKVVLEGAPGQTSTVSVQKTNNPQPAAASPAAPNENKDTTTTAKTTETPSSTKTKEKTETPSSTTTAEKKETPSETTTAAKTETPAGTAKIEKTETPEGTTKKEKTETPSGQTTAKTTETQSANKPEAPSSTTAKTTENPPPSNDPSSSERDEIHVNIENVESVDELLDRIDEAVQKAPVVIDTTPRGDKDQGLSIVI